MKDERLWWIGGVLVGLVTGMSLGLTYAWILDPPPLSLAAAASLNPRDREVYMVLVAAAYTADGNLDRAKERLARLEDADTAGAVVALAERRVSEGGDTRDVRVLASLADTLGSTSALVRPFIATPTTTPTSTHTPTPTSTSTITPTSTRAATSTRITTPAHVATPTATRPAVPTPTFTVEAGRFRIAQSTAVCDSEVSGLLRVYVRDDAGHGMPGIRVQVSWPGGEDRFYTGFKPSLDPGYADFEMRPGEVYDVALVDVKGDVARNVGAQLDRACPGLPTDKQPSWQIVFELP